MYVIRVCACTTTLTRGSISGRASVLSLSRHYRPFDLFQVHPNPPHRLEGHVEGHARLESTDNVSPRDARVFSFGVASPERIRREKRKRKEKEANVTYSIMESTLVAEFYSKMSIAGDAIDS